MKRVIILTIISSLFWLFGFATTKMTSVRDRNFRNISYEHILVSAVVSDLELKQTTEVGFMERLNAKGIKASSGMELFSPTREYADKEIITGLERDSIDAILVVALTDYWSTQTYIPETATTRGPGLWRW